MNKAELVSVIADKTAGPGLISIPYYRTSYAHFALGPGEIVNVGFVHLEAAKKMRSAFGTALAPELTVSEWGLEDIERFKRTRPQIAAQLTTRLMTVAGGPASPEEKRDTCARWRKAKADGLAQAVPTECAAPTPAAAANMPAPSPQ